MERTKGGSLILRIYFAVVSAVTLFTLMYGAIDFLAIGLKTFVFKAADVPPYGLINCDDPTALEGYYGKPIDVVQAPTDVEDALTEEERQARCEASNATTMDNYEREKANQAVRNLALIIISLPLFALHFRIVYRDWKGEHVSKT